VFEKLVTTWFVVVELVMVAFVAVRVVKNAVRVVRNDEKKDEDVALVTTRFVAVAFTKV
jgi:hypothetical protein